MTYCCHFDISHPQIFFLMFLFVDVETDKLVGPEIENNTGLKWKMQGLHLNPALGGVTKGGIRTSFLFKTRVNIAGDTFSEIYSCLHTNSVKSCVSEICKVSFIKHELVRQD